MNSRLDFPSQALTGTNPSGPALVDRDGDGKPTDVTACMRASRLRIDQEGSSLTTGPGHCYREVHPALFDPLSFGQLMIACLRVLTMTVSETKNWLIPFQ